MGKLMATLLFLVPLAGGAYAQADLQPLEVSCADFSAMEPDEQGMAIEDALTAAADTPAAVNAPSPDTPSADVILEAVTPICTANGEMKLGEALEQAMAN